MLIIWRKEAQTDMSELLQYIAQNNIAAAYEVHEQINQQVDALNDHPQLGRPGRLRGTRELVVSRTPYIVAYRSKGDAIHILRVLHGAQQWPVRF